MKRLATLLLAAGIAFSGMTGTAKAVELTANGTWQFGWTWSDVFDNGDDTFNAVQRMRTQFNFIASEELRGVLMLEIGNGWWGSEDGFAMGTDGFNVKVRYGYVDWIIPGADVKVRMGLQPIATPTFTFNETIMGSDNDVAGITMNYQFNDMVGVTLAWARPYNDYSEAHDAIDLFVLSVPIQGEGFQVTPYGVYGSISQFGIAGSEDHLNDGWGSNLGWLAKGLLPANAPAIVGSKSNGHAWWLGIGGELTLFDPLRVALDFAYGSVDFGSAQGDPGFSLDRKGWVVSAETSYDLDLVTPKLVFWYASGDNGNVTDGSERMPFIYPSNDVTNFGFDGGWFDADQISQGSAGKWGIGLHFDDITLIEQLRHDLRFTYLRGTNNTEMARVADLWNTDGLYLTTSDSAWEIDFDTKYQIYKNLAMHVELSYIKLDLDDATWGPIDSDEEKAYKAGVYMTYKF